MQVITTLATHSFQGSKNSFTPKKVNSGIIFCTNSQTPSSVIPKPITPIIVKITKDLDDYQMFVTV